jgi:hypothetical protein
MVIHANFTKRAFFRTPDPKDFTSDGFVLDVFAPPLARYVIERSGDLKRREPIGELPVSDSLFVGRMQRTRIGSGLSPDSSPTYLFRYMELFLGILGIREREKRDSGHMVDFWQ